MTFTPIRVSDKEVRCQVQGKFILSNLTTFGSNRQELQSYSTKRQCHDLIADLDTFY